MQSEAYQTDSKIALLAVVPSIHYLSVMAICSSMAEPVFAFQFPDIDVLLGKTNKPHKNNPVFSYNNIVISSLV